LLCIKFRGICRGLIEGDITIGVNQYLSEKFRGICRGLIEGRRLPLTSRLYQQNSAASAAASLKA